MEILSLLASVTFVASVITFLFRKLMSKDNLKHNAKVILYSYIAMSVIVAIYPFVSIEESFRFIVMMGNIGLFTYVAWFLFHNKTGKPDILKIFKIWLGVLPLQLVGDILMYREFDIFENIVDFSLVVSIQLIVLLLIAMYKRHEIGEFLAKCLAGSATLGTVFFTIAPPIEILQVTVNFVVLIILQAPIAFVLWRLYLKCYNSKPSIKNVVDVK